MKILKIAYYLLIYFVLSTSAYAANHYIRAGATGANNGTDWTNAWTTLPSTLTRGDTYYFADGTYGGYTFDDADSGSLWIYIKKATTSAHGTDTGWSSTYGDGTATFTGQLYFGANYIEVDGVTGGGPTNWEGPFGFKSITTLPGPTPGDTAVNFHFDTSGKGNYVTIKHFEAVKSSIPSQSESDDYWHDSIVEGDKGNTNLTISYCWFHYSVRAMIKWSSATNWVIEYSKLGDVYGNSSQHAEIFSVTAGNNITIRYNWIYGWRSTGAVYAISAVPVKLSNMYIYGNVFDGNDSANAYWVIGLGNWHDSQDGDNCKIYNNTFINLLDGAYVGVVDPGGSGNELYNNIFWNPGGQQRFVDMNYDPDPVGITHDYNWYTGSNVYSEAHGTGGGINNPFVNSGAEKYNLSSGIGGLSLPSPYNQDMFGNTRGADGTFDRGAFEYNNGGDSSIVPMPPGNLMIN